MNASTSPKLISTHMHTSQHPRNSHLVPMQTTGHRPCNVVAVPHLVHHARVARHNPRSRQLFARQPVQCQSLEVDVTMADQLEAAATQNQLTLRLASVSLPHPDKVGCYLGLDYTHLAHTHKLVNPQQ